MHPHLHLLVPSSSRNVLLEVRLYLSSVSPSIAGFSVRARSAPVRYDSADFGKLVTGVKHVIVASHPWGRLGGNMLFPVLSHHLVQAVLCDGHPWPNPSQETATAPSDGHGQSPSSANPATSRSQTALVTFNVRGVGHSQGWQPWLGASEDDFAAVERWAIDLLRPDGVSRVGYSWGCISAVHAPLPKDITLKSVVLISPALTPLKLLWWYQPLIRTITSYLQPEGRDGSKKGNRSSTKVTVIYGTRDDFTGVSTFRVFCDGLKALKGFQAGEISGAGHFWQSEEDGGEGEKLEETLRGCFQDEPVVEYS